jgi:hypothetical protein
MAPSSHKEAAVPGQIRRMIDTIIATRSQGRPLVAGAIRTKLILKGFNPEKYDATSPDDPVAVNKLREVARELGVNL